VIERTAELAGNLAAVQARLAAACRAADRPVGAAVLLAVTKGRPASDVRLLAALGVREFGENRDQEAGPKAAACADLGLGWHFLGRLQRNKCTAVARYANAVHSVDRLELVEPLALGARRAGRVVSALVQVSLDGDPRRGGAADTVVAALADAVDAADGLTLAGVMAVAPRGADPAAAFGRLAELAARVRAGHPAATVISAGMSADLEAAVAAGATLVRIGTALLGPQAAPVR